MDIIKQIEDHLKYVNKASSIGVKLSNGQSYHLMYTRLDVQGNYGYKAFDQNSSWEASAPTAHELAVIIASRS